MVVVIYYPCCTPGCRRGCWLAAERSTLGARRSVINDDDDDGPAMWWNWKCSEKEKIDLAQKVCLLGVVKFTSTYYYYWSVVWPLSPSFMMMKKSLSLREPKPRYWLLGVLLSSPLAQIAMLRSVLVGGEVASRTCQVRSFYSSLFLFHFASLCWLISSKLM